MKLGELIRAAKLDCHGLPGETYEYYVFRVSQELRLTAFELGYEVPEDCPDGETNPSEFTKWFSTNMESRRELDPITDLKEELP
jgi:hypothetical protein